MAAFFCYISAISGIAILLLFKMGVIILPIPSSPIKAFPVHKILCSTDVQTLYIM